MTQTQPEPFKVGDSILVITTQTEFEPRTTHQFMTTGSVSHVDPDAGLEGEIYTVPRHAAGVPFPFYAVHPAPPTIEWGSEHYQNVSCLYHMPEGRNDPTEHPDITKFRVDQYIENLGVYMETLQVSINQLSDSITDLGKQADIIKENAENLIEYLREIPS